MTGGEGIALGVDGCKAGWVGIVLGRDGGYVASYVHKKIADLVAAVSADNALQVVGIDIPIGLPDGGERDADRGAKCLLKSRASSVFTTPTRAALGHTSYAAAVAANREAGGKGISRQAYALRGKILEVDTYVKANTVPRVVEVHPEVSFVTMHGGALAAGKHTWSGALERRAVLRTAGIDIPDQLAAGAAGMDDVLDAAAAAWTAHRVATGTAQSLPSTPQVFSDGLPAAIWY